MARTGRPKTELVLSDEERVTLERLTNRRKSAQAIALRARIVLACAAGKANRQVAGELHITEQTVGKWRRRFVDKRLNGLFDEPRPGHPRTITDDKVEAVVVFAAARANESAAVLYGAAPVSQVITEDLTEDDLVSRVADS